MAYNFPYTKILTTNGYFDIPYSLLTNPVSVARYIPANQSIIGAFNNLGVVIPPRCFNLASLFDGNDNLAQPLGTHIITLPNGNYAKTVQDGGQYYLYFYYADDTPVASAGITLFKPNQIGLYFSYISFRHDTSDNSWGALYQPLYAYKYSSAENYIDWNLEGNAVTITNWLGDSFATDDPYSTISDDNPTGGYGNFNYDSDDILPPSAPSISAVDCGFVKLWNPTLAEMQALASYLWSGGFDPSQWRKLFSDPMECILSVGIVPVLPTTGTRSNIQFGSLDTGIESAPVSSQFVIEDMGTIDLRGQSASYMDYAPYARASIYLPYCGTYALDIDDIMDAVIALEYHIDIYTGACVAHLTITRTNSDGNTLHSTLYQFTGNCLATIPITAADHSAFLQSLLFMGAAVAATVATSGAAAPIAGAAAAGDVVAGSATAITTGSAINTVMSMKPDIQRSGNLSSTAGFLGQQKPYLTIKWSNLCRPEDEYKLKGMPLHKSGTLSDFSGFTIVSAVHMDNLYCTEIERDMIEVALLKGVII